MIVPVQESIPKTPDGYAQWPFSKDELYYATDAFFPVNQVSIEKIFQYRAHRIAQLVVAPIVYNPVRGQIMIKLIISGPDFFNPADQLAQWRSKMGYYVQHVSTAETGSSVTELKSYIQNAYDTWTTPPLAFVLLVGDIDTVPVPNGAFCGCASDSEYACLSGQDNVHDIFIGRISVSSIDEANSVFARFMNYAKASFSETDWIKYACFSSSCDSTYNDYHTHEYCLANYTFPQGYSGS
ncbi:hypothetical protein JXQ70_05505 [bacterium]|nr:hypothetical protein [bacterium]